MSDLERWEFEKSARQRELLAKEREQATKEAELKLKEAELNASRWRNPLVVGVFAAAVAGAGNAIVSFTNGQFQRELEAQKSEQARILEMIKTGDPDKAADNLRFLVSAGLILDAGLKSNLSEFLANRKPGTGPNLPSATGLSTRGTVDLTYFEAGMRITADGACSGDCSKYRNRTENTALVQPDTRSALDPLTVPYVVLPAREYHFFGMKLGDLCIVFNRENQRIAYAVVGDLGPAGHYGEGSIALAAQLGLSVDARSGGTSKGIVYIVIPDSQLSGHITPELIATEGAKRFAKWGGNSELQRRLKGG
ncbi:glycoside hydrolase family 75 protein [Variovorax rhizosphaerae]|uniref:Glycoside hydrolase family 75 protein n=1 Tax=Variovorax rhizosphaerae TaxID=1836200 RepID=A0ABU8WVW0_9BURK